MQISAQDQQSQKWPAQGNVWVVTIDHSSPMRSVRCDRARLEQVIRSCDIDYERDYFILALAGIDKFGPGDLGEQLLHVCDSGKFVSSKGLTDAILRQWNSTSPRYTSAYVSLLSYYSVNVGAREIKRLGKSSEFADICVITVTSDALEHDEWNLDQRGLRAAGVLEEAMKVKSALLSNEGGAGTLSRTHADEHEKPFIRVYKYSTVQSQTVDSHEDCSIQVSRKSDGSICVSLPNGETRYGKVKECYLQELKINGKHYPVDTLWQLSEGDSLLLPLGCRDALVNNRFELKGAMRILYNDSIYGPHYKEVTFDYQGKARSELFGVWIRWVLRGVVCVLAIYILIRLIIIPWKRLYVIYVAGRKFVVRHSFASRWRKRRPLLICDVDSDGRILSARVGDWRRVRVGVAPRINASEVMQDSYLPMDESILLVSRRPLRLQKIAGMGMRNAIPNVSEMDVPSGVFVESVTSRLDIDQYYIGRIRRYPAWVAWRYGKTLAARLRGRRAAWLNRLGDIVAFVFPRHYSCVMSGKREMERMVISHPKMHQSGFIDFEHQDEKGERR